MIFKIIFLLIYIFFIFHIYIFLYLIHGFFSQKRYFGIILRLVTNILVSSLIAFISNEIKHIFHYLFQLFFSILHLFIWANALLFFVFTFDEALSDIIFFKKEYEVITQLFNVYYILIEKIYRLLLFIAHFSNIFSIIRIIEICKHKNKKKYNLLLFESFLYIFLDIFILTPGYFFIVLLPPVFISTHVNICKRISKNEIYNKDENLYPKYSIIKSQIFIDVQKVFIYIISIILTFISFIFTWKINIFIIILIELFKSNDYKQFFINYFDNLIDSLIQILYSVFGLIIDIIAIILTVISFVFIWKINISLIILIEFFKSNDYKQFFINYFKNLIKCLAQILFFFLSLIFDTIAIILTITSFIFIWNLKKTLKIIIEYYKTKDFKKFLFEYFYNLKDCLFTTGLSVLTILNHISPIHLKALYDCYYTNKNKDEKYLNVCLIIFIEKWVDLFVFTISLLRLFSINFYIYLIIIKKCKMNFFFLLFDNKMIKKEYSNKKNRFQIIKILFFDCITNLVMIIQILLGILNPFFSLKIIKDIFLYFITCKKQTQIKFPSVVLTFIRNSFRTIFKLLFFYLIYLPISLMLNIMTIWTIKYNINLIISNNKSAFHKLKNHKEISLEYNNKTKETIDCSKYCDNLKLIFLSFIRGYILIFKFICIHLNICRIIYFWIKFKKDDKISFENMIDAQYKLSIIELIYTPYIYIIIIIEPWNYDSMKKFLEEKDCSTKFNEFIKLIKLFVNDIRLILMFILLMITLIDTIPTIL